MFKRTRRKIVAAIMMILVLMWMGTLGLIYASSYSEMLRHNKEVLAEEARMYELPQSEEKEELSNGPEEEKNSELAPDKNAESSRFQPYRIYMVAISYDGDVLDIKNDSPEVYSDEELIELTQKIIKGDKTNRVDSKLAFYKVDKDGYTLVAFRNNTGINGGARILFQYILSFGIVTLTVFFFLSVFLARKIVAPLERNYQKQKQFISDAGHELKTPVSIVNANVELLSREIGDNQWLQNIQYENGRMDMLVGQLLDLARTETATPQMEHIDFSRLVAGEALPFESVAFEKELVLSCDIPNGIYVEGDSAQLKQIVSILLDNAVRHSKEPGEIRLTLTKEHGFAKLSVINKGDEIPVEQRKQIFERFYRVDTARNGEDKHYGLGLAIAKVITTSHKGQIEVQCYTGLVEFKVKIPAL